MKLTGRDGARYFSKPDAGRTGVLIYGPDAMRIALKRQELIAALIGPQGEEEMRLTRIPASDLRKDPALLGDAIKAVSFFPAPASPLSKTPTTTPPPRFSPRWKTGPRVMLRSLSPLASSKPLPRFAKLLKAIPTPMPPPSTTTRPAGMKSNRTWPSPACATSTAMP